MPKSGSNACTWCARTPRDPACACVGLAINKHILIFGDEKRTALERAEISDAFDAPFVPS